jgi:hypothetical protein
VDIKRRLADAAGETYGGSIGAPLTGGAELARDALAEIERLESLNAQCIDLVRVSCPGIGVMTRHTISLEKPLPALNPGDSILLQVLPNR